MRFCLYQTEIPQNAGTMLRLAACLGASVDLIDPLGFAFGDRRVKRAGMDYLADVDYERYSSWESYLQSVERQSGRLILLAPHATLSCYAFTFHPTDILMVGRESDGVPSSVEADVDASVHIPMPGQGRSLNVAVALAMVAGEAFRQVSTLR